MSTKDIKQALKDDLVSFSDNIGANHVEPFLVEPEELDNRGDLDSYIVNIWFGNRQPSIVVDGGLDYETEQEVIVQVYVKSERMKGNEDSYEFLFDDLVDDVFNWIQSLAEGNRIWDVTNEKLRVPSGNGERLFTDQTEPIRIGKSTYTRLYFEPIRKTN